MSGKETAKRAALSLYRYFCFFLLMAFVISCCTMLFVSTMAKSMQVELTEENINTAAILTFWNVVLLSAICTAIDALRRKYTVARPVSRIVEAAGRIAAGDYSVRIPHLSNLNRDDGLCEIASCFNRMAEELSGVETLQTDFIANVSHELKTPLAVMQNYATLLSSPTLSEEERLRCARGIGEASRRLGDLIGNILRLNKLENQQIPPVPVPYFLDEQICECLLGFESVWEERGIDLQTDIAEGVRIHADPSLLSLVWNNLFSNAFKFTERGGCVSVTLKCEGDRAILSVRDTGCGITPEVGQHLFEKFYQGDRSHATGGNGLGLALVKRVIELVGADIAVESEVGQGSTFTVRIGGVTHEAP